MDIELIKYMTEDVVQESSYDVMQALLNAYDKAWVILENYDEDDLSSFDIFQEGYITEWKGPIGKAKQQTMDKNPGFVPPKPKFKFRQTKKNGKKESIIKSIWKLIPRMVSFFKETHRRKMELKRLKYIQDQAKKMGVTVEHMTPGELELFYTICNKNMSPKEIKKLIRKENWNFALKNALLKNGLKIGAGAIVVGGFAYELKTDGSFVRTKFEDFKGKVAKKLDDSVLSKIRDTGQEVSEKIGEAGKKVVDAIEKVSNTVVEAMKKAIEYIKHIFASLKKYFRVKIQDFDETSDDNIVCKFDPNNGSFKVTLNLDLMNEMVKKSTVFIQQAAKLIARQIKNGAIVKTDSGKREGLFVDAEREKANEKNPVKRKTMPESIDFANKYIDELSEMFNKSTKTVEYPTLKSFTDKSLDLSKKLGEMNKVLDELMKLYDARINASNADDNSWIDVEKKILDNLRGILDIITNTQHAIGAVDEYIENLVRLAEMMTAKMSDNISTEM